MFCLECPGGQECQEGEEGVNMKTNCANCRWSRTIEQPISIDAGGNFDKDVMLCCCYNPPVVNVVSFGDHAYSITVFPEVDEGMVCKEHAIATVFLDE